MSFNSILEAELLAAHEARDHGALVGLYRQAGVEALARKDVDAGCFYLTHAYVFGLETGDLQARDIHALLVKHRREE